MDSVTGGDFLGSIPEDIWERIKGREGHGHGHGENTTRKRTEKGTKKESRLTSTPVSLRKSEEVWGRKANAYREKRKKRELDRFWEFWERKRKNLFSFYLESVSFTKSCVYLTITDTNTTAMVLQNSKRATDEFSNRDLSCCPCGRYHTETSDRQVKTGDQPINQLTWREWGWDFLTLRETRETMEWNRFGKSAIVVTDWQTGIDFEILLGSRVLCCQSVTYHS